MQPVQDVKQPISIIFEPIVGKVKIKTYFSYYGIFVNGFMLALYKDDIVYLRASSDTKETLQTIENTYPLQDQVAGIHTKNFYALNYHLAQNDTRFPDWVKSILNELNKNHAQEQEKRKTQIRSLTNMNIKMERILKKINIRNVEQFQQKGYMNTFIELIKQGADRSDLLLYKLHGAFHQKSIYHMTFIEKTTLLQEANQAFYDAGLRHKFDIPNEK